MGQGGRFQGQGQAWDPPSHSVTLEQVVLGVHVGVVGDDVEGGAPGHHLEHEHTQRPPVHAEAWGGGRSRHAVWRVPASLVLAALCPGGRSPPLTTPELFCTEDTDPGPGSAPASGLSRAAGGGRFGSARGTGGRNSEPPAGRPAVLVCGPETPFSETLLGFLLRSGLGFQVRTRRACRECVSANRGASPTGGQLSPKPWLPLWPNDLLPGPRCPSS